MQTPDPERLKDFSHRRDATLSWLDESFKQAKAQNARGIFIFMHANPRFGLSENDRRVAGFQAISRHLQQLSANYARPVVLAHGDHHRFIEDNPFTAPRQGPRVSNFIRLQSPGRPRIGWVKVTIRPDLEKLFVYEKKTSDR